MKKYVCSICGFVYDESKGIPESGIAPGTKWEDLPDDWACPLCRAPKSAFASQAEESSAPQVPRPHANLPKEHLPHTDLHELPSVQLAAICSNLAKGCEKQYLAREADLFSQLASYYESKSQPPVHGGFSHLLEETKSELTTSFPDAHGVADASADRGAKRALTWSEKVTRIQNALLDRYEKEGNAMLQGNRVWLCDICGFIYIGDAAPDVCPVCKVPRLKILEVTSA